MDRGGRRSKNRPRKRGQRKRKPVALDTSPRPPGCRTINLPDVAPGWGCCACEAQEGVGTYNGEQRDVCKHCGHPRCSGEAN